MRNLRVEDTYFKAKQINVNGNLIDFDVPKIMAILNYTNDSFFAASRLTSNNELLNKTEQLLIDGADIIDIGGFSTRPNAQEVDLTEEISRIRFAVDTIKRAFPTAIISVDTFRSEVAQTAIDFGAGIINDISGFTFDPKLLEIVSRNKVPYVLMHLQGSFETMHNAYHYHSVYADVVKYFLEKITILEQHSVKDIILDPGFGFSKNIDQNYELFYQIEKLHIFEKPLLIGISRKSMIYKKLGITAEESLNGTIALNAIALSKRASILRVHDVAEARDLIQLLG